jgi:hypothetical protein
MTEKKQVRVIKVPKSALREFRLLKQRNELLQERVGYLEESISVLRDVIQTFQARTNLEGAIHKTELQALIKAVSNEQ